VERIAKSGDGGGKRGMRMQGVDLGQRSGEPSEMSDAEPEVGDVD